VVTEYTRQILLRLRDGYELVADSRVLEKAAKRRARPRVLSPAQVKKLSPWEALKYWGTLHRASDDARVQKVTDRSDRASEPEVQFAALRSVQSTAEKVTITGSVAGAQCKSPYLWVRGDLHIRGSLELGVDLLVSGNLTVDGVLRDTREWTHFLVGGNVKAGALDVGSQLYAGGEIVAELVVIDGTGQLKAGKALRTRLLVEEGYDHQVRGKQRVTHAVDFANRAESSMATLEKLLTDPLAAAVRRKFDADGDDFYFPKSVVIDAWKAGKRVWR